MARLGTGQVRSAPPAAGPSVARDLNTSWVVGVLRDFGPQTQAELTRRSGLARPTVAAIVRELRRRHVVADAGPDRTPRNGRPGALLAFDPRCATVAVVRLLPSDVDIWIGDCDGDFLVHRHTRRPDPPRGVDGLPEVIAQLADQNGLPRPGSIGLLLVGRVDPSTDICSGPALGPEPVPLTALEDRLGVAVTVLNPTAAAALGVARTGRYSDALVIFLDRGIGAGIVSAGQVLVGADGGAGELGHCRLSAATRRCQCGRSGCLETVAAGWYLAEQAAEILGPGVEVPVTLAGLESLGHAEIDGLLAEAARQLGLATSWLVSTLNPQAVLLGGTPFAVGAPRFLTAFAASVRENAIEANGRDVIIDVADQTSDIDGAAAAALDRLRVGGA